MEELVENMESSVLGWKEKEEAGGGVCQVVLG
jgi:hypothetical protein